MAPKGKTFEPGHFHKHNEEVLAKLREQRDLKQAVNDYAEEVAKAAKMLHDAGASDEQVQSSMQARRDQFDRAWEAITENTAHAHTV